jgi:trk system potassium uptake protein TrkA
VALVAILRDQRVITPTPDDPLEGGDELLFVAAPDQEDALHDVLATITSPTAFDAVAAQDGGVGDSALDDSGADGED